MYTLRFSPDSASLIVRLVLEELALPYTARPIDRDGGELASPEYRALHPLGKIPAMETPNGPMFESAAILLYLSDRHPGLAPAPDAPDRAAFLKWFFFTSTNIHTTLMDIFYPDRVAGEAVAGAVLIHASARMNTLLSALNDAATDTPGWLPADRPSLLGYYIAVLMRWLGQNDPDAAGYVDCADYPALQRVLAMLETRPAAIRVAKAEGLGETIFTKPG
jgi:glutathione S-transferase